MILTEYIDLEEVEVLHLCEDVEYITQQDYYSCGTIQWIVNYMYDEGKVPESYWDVHNYMLGFEAGKDFKDIYGGELKFCNTCKQFMQEIYEKVLPDFEKYRCEYYYYWKDICED